MTYNLVGIDEMEVKTDWKTQKLVACIKIVEGRPYIDLRKWVRGVEQDSYRPRLGIMLSMEDWTSAIEVLKGMINDNTKQL